MEVQRAATVFGSQDWSEDVVAVSALLGKPSLVEAVEWAQFEHNGVRVAVGAAPEIPQAALMLQVDDVAAAGAVLAPAGFEVDEPVLGIHEVPVYARRSGGLPVIAYSPNDTTPPAVSPVP